MDVYLIPTTQPRRYELYYEPPDGADAVDDDEAAGDGWVSRVKRRFSAMVREAEEWRLRRNDPDLAHASFLTRVRRRVMGFIVERIAEQRLLWHLRKATEVCACIPADITDVEADIAIRGILRKDLDHHFRWMWIDFALLVPSAFLVIVPGPNIPGFYFTFQVVGHYLSWNGAKKGLAIAPWTFKRSSDLSELRAALALAPAQRQPRVLELAERLRLQHLATFLEDVAARPA